MVTGQNALERSGKAERDSDGRGGIDVRWLVPGLACVGLLAGALLWDVDLKVSITPTTSTITTASVAPGSHETHATMVARDSTNCVTLAIGREGAETRALPCTASLPALRESTAGRTDLAELKTEFLSGIASAIAQSDEPAPELESTATAAD